jgi:hypothetical protein
MPFTPGHKAQGGRPKGSQNKGTEQLRKKIATLTERNYPRLSEALESIEAENPAKFVELYLKLLSYTLPQLQAIKQEIEVGDDILNRINIHVVKAETTGSKELGTL